MFGHQLERSRNHGILAFEPNKPQRALLLGDGDGRFSELALKQNPQLQIDSIERSFKMREQARLRLRKSNGNIVYRHHYVASDAKSFQFPKSEYDIVVAQFFLDCFPTKTANAFLSKFARTLKPYGKFVYTDFSIPKRTSARWIGEATVSFLYLFFRLTTDIEATHLPNLASPKSLQLTSRKTYLNGILSSEISSKTHD